MSSIDLVVSPPKRPAFLLLLLLSTDKQLKARPPTFLTTKPRRHSQVKVDSRVPRRLLATLITEKRCARENGDASVVLTASCKSTALTRRLRSV